MTFVKSRLGMMAFAFIVGAISTNLKADSDLPVRQESPPLNSALDHDSHQHKPVVIHARPIVKRLKVPFVRPRRMLIGEKGEKYLADWGAGTVVRISSTGQVTTLADNLNEPAGLALDGMGNLFVSTHAAGMPREGKIYKIDSEGMKQVYAAGLTGPTALAFDPQGNLYVANFHDNAVFQVSTSGELTTYAANIPTPSGLIFGSDGALYVTSSTEGTVYKISAMSEVLVFARGLTTPSDITIDSKGHLIVTNFGQGRLSHVTKTGRIRSFAIVPRGTISSAVDARGNLWILNWDDHYLMSITTSLRVKCPHCDQHIPIQLRSSRKKRPAQSEEKPEPMPVI
ncbi:MAG: hypothetical protein Tsb009_39960 [Planctomycetaceae bacterium]